jgi:hypothetical protein
VAAAPDRTAAGRPFYMKNSGVRASIQITKSTKKREMTLSRIVCLPLLRPTRRELPDPGQTLHDIAG